MDTDEWELLPSEGFLEFHTDDGGKMIYSRKFPSASNSVIHSNYFISPPKSTPQQPLLHDQILPISVHLLPPKLPPPPPPLPPEEIKACVTGRDPVSQVFFKKMTENEFVDMKLDSPKPGGSISSTAGVIQFQEQGMEETRVLAEVVISGNKNSVDLNEGGMNIWKWSLSGIGAICSFGLVVATVCGIIVLGNGSGDVCKQTKQNQKIQLQIYTNDKSMNQAIPSMKGIPISKARITFGGHYNEAIEL